MTSSHTHLEIYFALFDTRVYADLLHVSLCFNTLLLYLLVYFCDGYRVHTVVYSVLYCIQHTLSRSMEQLVGLARGVPLNSDESIPELDVSTPRKGLCEIVG